ncbi:MAG TPA: hypothetical protein VHM01_15480 [Alphaproteobacteria bacterium]|nr:hypothetical protein [Alphaproteobacteria bacterium]
MTRIGTPTPGLVATPLPQGAPATALLAELPSTLSNVALGTFLTGTVLDRGANGMTLLQTANGVLGLKTTVPLPPGSTVTLQIQTAGAQLQAIVLSITPQTPGRTQPPLPQAVPSGGHPAMAAPHAPASPQPIASSSQPDRPAAVPSAIVATVIGPAGGPVPAAAAAQPAAAAHAPQTTTASATANTTAASVASATSSATPAPTPAATPQPTATPAPPAAQSPPAPNQPQQAPTTPAAVQAAYQRQLNALPATAPPAAPAAPLPAAVSHSALSAEQAARPLAPDAAPAPLPTGTQIQVRLIPAATPGTAQAAPHPTDVHAETLASAARQPASMPSQSVAALMMATVVARTPAGQVILDSAVGRLLAPLPRDGEATEPGARLLLELIAGERPAAPRAGAAGSDIASLARNWQGLKDAMRQLQEAPGQQDAYAALERAVPKAGPRLAQQMLSYLETAQQGVKAWLGEAVSRALAQTGRGPEQLERDMREMMNARQAAEGDWRMTLVPLLDGQQLRQIRFFERRRKQEEAKRKKEEPARFVVECETSEHGAIQLDGLMHEQRLDLIVRSHAALPSEMERDILLLFGQTCTGLNLNGQLFFQAVPTFPINPLDDVAAEPVRVSV